jgi:hypothetical protein
VLANPLVQAAIAAVSALKVSAAGDGVNKEEADRAADARVLLKSAGTWAEGPSDKVATADAAGKEDLCALLKEPGGGQCDPDAVAENGMRQTTADSSTCDGTLGGLAMDAEDPEFPPGFGPVPCFTGLLVPALGAAGGAAPERSKEKLKKVDRGGKLSSVQVCRHSVKEVNARTRMERGKMLLGKDMNNLRSCVGQARREWVQEERRKNWKRPGMGLPAN